MTEVQHPVDRGSKRADSDITEFRANPDALAGLALGRFSDAGVRSLLLRRLLLKVPPAAAVFCALAAHAGRRWQSKAGAFAAELAYWRRAKSLLSRAEWESLVHGPVILMYHALGAPSEPASRYVLPESRFRRQLAWLRRRGYRVISLGDLARARAQATLPPPHALVLTFDDGYHDNVGALARANMPASVFVVTGGLGGRNAWDPGGDLAGRALLDWDEARQLARAGIEVGAHTRTHPSLPDVDAERLVQEVGGSLEDLQRELGPGAYTFAYPHGRFDVQTQQAVASAGFAAACCSRGGVNDPRISRFELRRVEIKGTDSFASFMLMVWLGRRITPLQFLRSLLVG